MDLLAHLSIGLTTALTVANLSYAFLGVLIGTLIGVLPGLGPVATIAMLLPATYALEPESAIIMLAGIYYGAQYGGSTTAILVNLPGESSSIVTCLDGYAMARRGRAGAALAIAAIGSFFAGTVATLLIAAFAAPLSRIALSFGPAEYFSLMVLGLIGAVVLAHGSLLKAIAVVALGLLLGMIGPDLEYGITRFGFGVPELADGLGFIGLSMGLFAFREIVANLEGGTDREVFTRKMDGLWLTRSEARQAAPAVLRGTAIGAVLGVLPGGGALLSSFASYTLEKRIARDPSRFGEGAIEGVAGPESANNAGAQTSFVPMLTLGIPTNPTMAMMIGALALHNIQPGPRSMTANPELFWGLIASMWIGNLLLVILNLPLVGIWVRLLSVPYRMLYPAIILFCLIGVYTVAGSAFDVWMLVPFALFGVLLHKLGCEPAPLLLGFTLGPTMEENLRRALLLSRGDPSVLVTRPISALLLAVTAALVVVVAVPAIRRTRAQVFNEADA
ncbi:tripartite tricarboxylate transporter permease [Inquilinus limosus]|uniref:DUF112 domain-containing protein n=1 Tax=Inquilinus limosus TaxID=171674 RepID=A0A211ZVC7_9PROT|nr:tripartite tricarboxylate transporter permease [Inquilinus limosus]OWJ69169.1 hypothetical protein BWR60_01160 [Inquilinus limosus]